MFLACRKKEWDMNDFLICGQKSQAMIFIEPEAYEGVRKIGERVAKDIELVTGHRPELAAYVSQVQGAQVIVGATVGRSRLLSMWQEGGQLDSAGLAGKRESYQICIVENPFPEKPSIERALVIAGSDKRGTIYGLFHLSELCGVSPLVYWGDAAPCQRQELVLEIGAGILSKEPSVRYRGFFINDEWPAFGNWCAEHFGGINANVYEEIFIFLLRMKGNYLWPAMWDSVFSEDGPGLANAELADMLGVIIGSSHHEPMCRAGAEWQRMYRQYGEDNTWSFVTNREAITEFWKDGLLRNRPFENLITIGMRGECDSKLLSEDAGLAENIQTIKNVVLTQHRLIREHINEDLAGVPRMMAIYKEVEDYYYGDDTCEGLKDWSELDDVILMLCDDNFGNVRGLPTKEDHVHPGGYGMYYHFDYHGAPISYEWQNSNRLTKTWEQMTMVYDCGVRELWIVNVGDIKGTEYPLMYFMALAYDYETWSPENRVEAFVKAWIDQQFLGKVTGRQKAQLFRLTEGWTRWSAARRPEAMNPQVYHPCNYGEGDRVWEEVNGLMELAEELHRTLPEDCLNAYESLLYYPAAAVLNLILMHVEAGMNAHFAERGSLGANAFGERVKERIRLDRQYVDAYHSILGGKWNHMMDSAHTGFRRWDDSDWGYPVIRQVVPVHGAKIAVGFRGSGEYHLGTHWQDGDPVCNEDFERPDTGMIRIDLDSRGDMDFCYSVHSDQPWLQFSPASGRVEISRGGRAVISVTCDRKKLKGRKKAGIEIHVKFDNGEETVGRLALTAGLDDAETDYPKGTFLEQFGYIAMDASHFSKKHDTADGGFQVIRYLGRMGDAVKAFPAVKNWMGQTDLPCLQYDAVAQEEGTYTVWLYLAPRNPVRPGGQIRCQISVNDGPRQIIDTVSSSMRTEGNCGEWSRGVLDNIRVAEAEADIKKGMNHLYFYAGDPGIVLERIVLFRKGKGILSSFLGPKESWRV